MARKAAANAKGEHGARKRGSRRRSTSPPNAADPPKAAPRDTSSAAASSTPDFAFAKMAKMMTPDQAIALYKANAALALDVINAAIEGAARVRSKQREGEEEAREFQRKHAQSAAQARDPQALIAAGQGAAQEALERSMRYWSEMFELIVEIQKRVFTLIETQMEDVPGVRETRAAMALLPDVRKMQDVVSAMQGMVASGGSTFASMQRAMADFARLAQGPVAR